MFELKINEAVNDSEPHKLVVAGWWPWHTHIHTKIFSHIKRQAVNSWQRNKLNFDANDKTEWEKNGHVEAKKEWKSCRADDLRFVDTGDCKTAKRDPLTKRKNRETRFNLKCFEWKMHVTFSQSQSKRSAQKTQAKKDELKGKTNDERYARKNDESFFAFFALVDNERKPNDRRQW